MWWAGEAWPWLTSAEDPPLCHLHSPLSSPSVSPSLGNTLPNNTPASVVFCTWARSKAISPLTPSVCLPSFNDVFFSMVSTAAMGWRSTPSLNPITEGEKKIPTFSYLHSDVLKAQFDSSFYLSRFKEIIMQICVYEVNDFKTKWA